MIEQREFGMFEQNERSKITDSMIVAGSDAIEEFWVDLTSPVGTGLALVPKLVERIYSVMETARQSPPKLRRSSIVERDG